MAKDNARYLRTKILTALTNNEISKWQDIETNFGIDLAALLPPGLPITDAFRNATPLRFNLAQLLDAYVANTEKRLLAAQLSAADDLPKLKLRPTPESECYKFKHAKPDSEITQLLPEQDPVMRLIWSTLFDKQTLEPGQPPARAILQNGKTGSGKTVVANALIDRFIAAELYKPDPIFPIPLAFPIIWLTVSNAVEQTRRSLISVGLGEFLDTIIHVIGYSDLITELGYTRFVERVDEVDPFDPDGRIITTFNWRPSAIPKFLILDEAHSVQNESSIRTQVIRSLDLTERKLINPMTQKPLLDMKVLFLTATPVERIPDLKLFICMTNLKFQGQLITYDNFTTAFANLITNGKPEVVTKEATKRLWQTCKHRIIELPRVKWKHKAINMCRIYEFETDEDRKLYLDAWDRHVERCRLLGKDPDAGATYTSLMIFAKEVEPIRARQIVREMYENVVKDGRSSVMATRFTGTIIRGVFSLMDTYGITRDKISIIWGGRKNIKPDKILTVDDLNQIFMNIQASGGVLDAETKRLIKRNLAWQEDRLLFGDSSDAAQDARYQRLLDLKLVGVQTKERRQQEIDKFMSGEAVYCFFTADSGGTGLSLEHKSARTTPRVLWATPIYNGKQFTQVMGRCPRRVSWSDTYQYICLMNRTIESEHVAPILDNKLQAAGEFTSAKDDIAMALANKKLLTKDFRAVQELDTVLRDKAAAEAMADDEKSQLYGDGSKDETETEEEED